LSEANTLVTEYRTRNEAIAELLNTAKEINGRYQEQLSQTTKELTNAENRNHQYTTELRFKEQQLSTQKEQLQDIGKKFEDQFTLLAQKILEEKTTSFNNLQEKSITELLNPLKENIASFKTAFEAKYKTESDDRISLREQIKHMLELNNTLSTQANNLTNALRGQVKQQGNWGEMMLESILEYADLQKGIHYFVQERTAGEEGNALQPDIIVRYPDDRSIVIDSKVSLLHYEQYSNATEVEAQKVALGLLTQSMYRHIDDLSGKKYQDAVGALDFVMLFVPVEGAYITIMQAERQLWQYAYKKRVLLISPTNLIAAMKLVYDLWKREGINQNAHEIAEKAVKIYEKLAAFVEDFEKIGSQLDKASATFKDAQKKLHTGRGNVLSQASQMKQKVHHTKPARELPAHLVDQALSEEENEATI
jgi:DNA recombination protein RmuC